MNNDSIQSMFLLALYRMLLGKMHGHMQPSLFSSYSMLVVCMGRIPFIVCQAIDSIQVASVYPGNKHTKPIDLLATPDISMAVEFLYNMYAINENDCMTICMADPDSLSVIEGIIILAAATYRQQYTALNKMAYFRPQSDANLEHVVLDAHASYKRKMAHVSESRLQTRIEG